MSKGAYIGINGIAKKVKKGYIGINNQAKKIKKAYIGISGVARPCWGSGELSYYGTITPLSQARQNLAATTVGNYALFGGGNDANSTYAIIDAYDLSLIRSTPTDLSKARQQLAATTIGDYALFGGGYYARNSMDTVDAYSINLTKSTPNVLSKDRYNLAATTIGDYALFGGGQDIRTYPSSAVDAYNNMLVKSTIPELSQARSALAATTVGEYALFGGGTCIDSDINEYYFSNIDIYNKSLVKGTTIELSEARSHLAATTIGNYALFGGGYSDQSIYSTVDGYTQALVRIDVPNLTDIKSSCVASTVKDTYSVFGGGHVFGTFYNTIDVYNLNLIKIKELNLSNSCIYLSVTALQDYLLFGGGYNGIYPSSIYDTVDVFTVS